MAVTPNKEHNCENIALHLCHVLHLQELRELFLIVRNLSSGLCEEWGYLTLIAFPLYSEEESDFPYLK